MKISRRTFSKWMIGAAASAGAPVISLAQSSQKASPTGDAPKPAFKPVGVERSKVLKVLSGRNRPDLTPVYKMWEQLTGMSVDLTKISHLDVMEKLISQKADPQYDLMLTNTMAEPGVAQAAGVFEPYRAKVATEYDEWLRASDYSWLSITAWPRTAMVNWTTMGRDPAKWPKRLEDLADPRFKDKVIMASIQESIVTSYFAALRVAKGDEWTARIIDRLFDNGMRLYKSHAQERNALVREGYGIALVNSSNAHVFFLEGNAVGEAWLDQEEGGLGTLVETHTIAVIRGAKNPSAARSFVDFILSKEIQEMLARIYGEGPVNPAAVACGVRPVGEIRRIKATPDQIAARFHDTQKFLAAKGFNMEDLEDPLISQGKSGRRRDKMPAGGVPKGD